MENPSGYIKNLAYSQKISLRQKCNRTLFTYNRRCVKSLRKFHFYLRDIHEKLVNLVPAAQWLIDNYYVINREARMIKENYNRRYCRKTPVIKGGLLNGYPRIYSIAREILKVTDYHCAEEDIIRYLNEYQTVKPLTVAELWAFPNVLKLNLIESIYGISSDIMESIKIKQKVDRVLDEITQKNINGNNDYMSKLTQRIGREVLTNPNYIAHILYQLKEMDMDDNAFKRWLNDKQGNTDVDITDIIGMESKLQASLQVKISSAFTSLIEVSAIDWEGVFEKVSVIERILNEDPARVYENMDFPTRDAYHHEIEIISRDIEVEEIEIAKKSVELSKDSFSQGRRKLCGHVGYYLLGKGNRYLKKSMDYNPNILKKMLDFIKERKGFLYFPGLFIITAVFLYYILLFTINNYEAGWITYFAMAVFTFILVLTASIEFINYLATRLSCTKKLPSMDFEEGIPDECKTAVVMPVIIGSKKQIKKYTDDLETYYLANRSDNLYFALLGDFKDAGSRETPEDAGLLEYAAERINRLNSKYSGDERKEVFFFLNRYRQMNEKQGCWMGWERKRGKLEEFNKLILGYKDTSYNTIIGNREIFNTIKYVLTIDADTELTKDSAKKLAGIMAHPLNHPVLNSDRTKVVDGYSLLQPRVGIRMKSAIASLFSRTFAGQAGIDPYINAVSDVYQDNFTEGIFAGKGIYDVKVFHKVLGGNMPENEVLSHDLLEGSYVRCALATDIELMDGYPSTVASFFKREHRWIRGDWQLLPWIFGRDSLGALARWKMIDNLRRSLIPVAQLGFIMLAAAIFRLPIYIWIPVVFFSMLFSLAVNVWDTIVLRVKRKGTGTFFSKLVKSAFMVMAQGFLLFILIPYRAWISLDAIGRTLYRLFVSRKNLLEWQTAESSERSTENGIYSYVGKMWPGIALGIFLIALSYSSITILVILIAFFWISSPAIGYWISKPLGYGRVMLNPVQLKELRLTARKTWRYFEDFFEEKDNWLTPDNYQVNPGNVLARRTSPTNIGLQLISTLCAWDMGYLGFSELYERLKKVLDTLNRLQKWNGHFYNWYNTRNLEVLNPQYISTVDSGNLFAYLVVLKNGLEDLKMRPILDEKCYRAILDGGTLANIHIDAGVPDNMEEWNKFLADTRDLLHKKPKAWMDEDWVKAMERQLDYYIQDIDNFHVVNSQIPSLLELADENNMHAEEYIDNIKHLCSRIENIMNEMDFKPLYDRKRNLFRVGFNISANSPDNSYYDLLASEARLTSFVAIAKNDVPVKHWFKLGRPLTLVHGRPTLISWSGTMFEYLLPNIVMNQIPNTILSQSNRCAIARQIEFARYRNIPWGISESGYYRFDMNLNYQYRAFGIPDLGFRSDLRKSLVISPYSTMLALEDRPVMAYRNLKRFKEIGAEGKYGFYEALDFLSPSVQKKARKLKYKLIQSYMIHHQGMSLVSLDNFFNNDVMKKRFHKEPMFKGIEVLLEECRPYGIVIKKEQEKVITIKPSQMGQKGYDSRVIQTTNPKYPVAHVLSNNRYTVMFTSNGNGLSIWNNIAVNRWRPVLQKETYGMFFYIRDTVSKKFWSSAYLPVMAQPKEYRVTFSPDKVEYSRIDGCIETKTEATISPQEEVEVRRITLTNRSTHTAKLDVTSYYEPVLDTYEADLAHPAFSKLFVSTEYVEEGNVLLATRRPRTHNGEKLYLFTTMCVKGKINGSIEFETDRNKFIGRGNTLRDPNVMKSDLPLSNTAGNVLDPVMSLRANIALLPGRSAVVTYVTGVSETREEALDAAMRYQKSYSIDDIFKLALFDSEVEMQYLGLSPKQVNAIQDLVGSIYYPSRLMRGPVDVIEKNTLGQSSLWKYGISGDLPIMTFRINNDEQVNTLKDVVSAYEYMRKNGIMLDFVILNEEKEDYFQPLNQRIGDIINNSKIYYPHSKNARIFLLKARHMSEEEINLLISVSRIVLSERNRLMSRRIRKQLMDEAAWYTGKFSSNSARVYENIPLSREELLFFNGMGGFTFDGKEYVILLNEGQQTPVPWTNVIANENFGFMVTNSGGGYTWAINSRENKVTKWSNDPVMDIPSEIIYIRDDDTGEFFSPTPAPIRGNQPYRIRHGLGYSAFEHNSNGLKQHMTLYVGERDPVKIYRVNLENAGDEKRKLSLYLYAELVMGASREETAPYIVSRSDPETNMLYFANTYNMEFKGQITFVSSSEQISSYTGDNMEFIGRRGHIDRPQGLFNEELSNRAGASLDPCAAIKTKVTLKPGESREVIFILGECTDIETVRLMVKTYTRHQVARVVLNRVKKYWSNIVEQIQVNTPDKAFNIIMNGWLLYQVLSCRMFSRSAFYQSGGAYGFRDQLQDSLAFLHSKPELAKEQIIKCCSRQFVEGDVQHWWHNDSGKGVRTRISDDLLWLPYATAVYVKYTGDKSILDENVSYLYGEELAPGESEKYTIPNITEEKGSVYEHCIRALEKGIKLGSHGLPLMGSGDWNDGMNSVGDEGKGESVWLGWFVYKVIKDFSRICKIKKDHGTVKKYNDIAEELKKNIDEHAWDGEWYLRAFFDNGETLGSRHNNECRIDSISQSWSAISGAGNNEKVEKAMNSFFRYLVQEEDRLIMLLNPPFDKSEPDPGYIKGYLPGIRENGGQYTHAALWAVIAYAKLGMGDTAYKLFNMINPITHAQNYSEVMKYKQEPYVVSADVYSKYPHAGRGGWSWYTGSAGWMYQAGIEWMLGIRKKGRYLYVNPVIPGVWKHFSFTYRFGEARYHIDVENNEGLTYGRISIMMNGREIHAKGIKLIDDGKDHGILVRVLSEEKKSGIG